MAGRRAGTSAGQDRLLPGSALSDMGDPADGDTASGGLSWGPRPAHPDPGAAGRLVDADGSRGPDRPDVGGVPRAAADLPLLALLEHTRP